MTEADWLVSENPQQMLGFVQTRVSDRQLRLVACAFCRRVWHLLVDPRSRHAVVASEAFADGRISGTALAEAEAEAHATAESIRLAWAGAAARTARNYQTPQFGAWLERLYSKGMPSTLHSANWSEEIGRVGSDAQWAAGSERLGREQLPVGSDEYHRVFAEAKRAEGAHQAALVRDIFGNPFRPATVSPEWRTSTAVTLAEQMYDSREFSAMPILADALQDAGCDSEDILNYCRDAGPHVRGCWVVDLVLGKE